MPCELILCSVLFNKNFFFAWKTIGCHHLSKKPLTHSLTDYLIKEEQGNIHTLTELKFFHNREERREEGKEKKMGGVC